MNNILVSPRGRVQLGDEFLPRPAAAAAAGRPAEVVNEHVARGRRRERLDERRRNVVVVQRQRRGRRRRRRLRQRREVLVERPERARSVAPRTAGDDGRPGVRRRRLVPVPVLDGSQRRRRPRRRGVLLLDVLRKSSDVVRVDAVIVVPVGRLARRGRQEHAGLGRHRRLVRVLVAELADAEPDERADEERHERTDDGDDGDDRARVSARIASRIDLVITRLYIDGQVNKQYSQAKCR